MRTPTLNATHLAIAATAIALGSGCTPVNRASGKATDGVVSSAGTSIPRNVAGPTELTESHTVSFALDRIDQHNLPLDNTYRHYGSGQNVTVYVFDGGVMSDHPELAGRYRRGFDAFPNEEHICNPHGTAVAGAIAGATLGVAPQSEIVDVKMVECRRMRGTIDAIVRGADWVIADAAQHPQRRAVANWSFIADTSSSIAALDSAVQRLLAAGIPVVVSAGNVELDACHISPGNSPGVINVGSSRVKTIASANTSTLVDERTPGTAYGKCIGVFAPGDSVLLPSMDSRHKANEQLWTGTSMAAGYVSGAAALYLEAHPSATAQDVVRYVKRSATVDYEIDVKSAQAGMLYVGTSEQAPQRVAISKH